MQKSLVFRFVNGLKKLHRYGGPMMKFNKGMIICMLENFFGKDETEKEKICQLLELPYLNDNSFKLSELSNEMVVELYNGIQNYYHYFKDITDSPLNQLYRAKSIALAKSILLICYHLGVDGDELFKIKLSEIELNGSSVEIYSKVNKEVRPLRDLQDVYDETLITWYRFRVCENPIKYFFVKVHPIDTDLEEPLFGLYYQWVCFIIFAGTSLVNKISIDKA